MKAMAALAVQRGRADVLVRGVLFAAMVMAGVGDAGARVSDRRIEAGVQARMNTVLVQIGAPGMTAAFARADGRMLTAAAGVADRELGRAMRPETRMFAGSVGKMFAAAVAVSLVQDGVLELDAPISRWLGADSEFAQLPNYDRITVRMLLNHTSGLPDYVGNTAFWAVARERSEEESFAFSPEALVAFAFGAEALSAPGEAFHYTDLGYIVLGLVMERAAHTSYYALLQRRFIYPLDLERTSPSVGRIFDGLSQGYVGADNPLLSAYETALEDGVLRIDARSEWTGGGLVSNSRDLAIWIKALFEGRTLLGAEYAQAMVTETAEIQPGQRYGLGVYVYDTEFGPLYSHGGWFMGYRSYTAYFPNCGVAAALQVNAENLNGSMAQAFRDIFGPALEAEGCRSVAH